MCCVSVRHHINMTASQPTSAEADRVACRPCVDVDT